jgi:hypothetical protein
MADNLSCIECRRPAAVAREVTELIRIHALTPAGTLGALFIELHGEVQGIAYLCSRCQASEQIAYTRRKRTMPVPRFATLDDAAAFVVQHHRLPAILALEDVAPFIEFIYDYADSEAPLPSLVLQFFRTKIERIDRQLGGD